jgi:glycosyltransferase involved in cell wall biosynthesis
MRALLVTEYSPYRTDFGAQQRSHLMWKAMGELGQVDVLMLQRGRETALQPVSDERLLAQATFRALPLGLTKYSPDAELNRLLARHADLGAYDVVCGRYLGPISKLDLPRRTPTVVDLDDIGYSYAARPGLVARAAAAGKSWARRRLERGALSRFTRYWFVCERDRGRFADLAGGILPNIPVAAGPASQSRSSGATLLFVGALWYGPNREGIERFLASCWPAIRRAEPGARLSIVGGAPQEDRARWASVEGVEAPGFVRDLAGAYARAAFTIAPIHAGGGTNIKVLESLAMGRTCVTTAWCLEGLRPHFDGRNDVLAAADAAAMTDACLRLLREPALREALARRGRQIVEERFSYDTFRSAVHEQVHLAAGGCAP